MSKIFGKPLKFLVNERAVFQIIPVENYTSGKPHVDYYLVEDLTPGDAEKQAVECRTWGDVQRHFAALGYEEIFVQQFPGAHNITATEINRLISE